MNKIFETWAKAHPDKLREDARLCAYAERLGFTVHCNPENEMSVPHDPISFSKGDRVIWEAVTDGGIVWRCADLVDGFYCNHRSYQHLKIALETEAVKDESVVLREGKEVFKGTADECFMYVIKHQPHSTPYAFRYGGWKIVKK